MSRSNAQRRAPPPGADPSSGGRETGGARDRNRPVGESVRDALIRAGQTLFAQHPADAVPIDDIVREAGVAKGSFYKHFPDKEALLAAVVRNIRNGIEAEVSAANAEETDPARRVARAMCVYFRYAADEPDSGGVLVRNDRSGQALPWLKLNKGAVEDVSQGLREGRFIVGTVEAGALYILGVGHAGLTRFNGEGAASNVWIAQQLCQLVLRGLGLPPTEAELIAAQAAEEILRGARPFDGRPPPGDR